MCSRIIERFGLALPSALLTFVPQIHFDPCRACCVRTCYKLLFPTQLPASPLQVEEERGCETSNGCTLLC